MRNKYIYAYNFIMESLIINIFILIPVSPLNALHHEMIYIFAKLSLNTKFYLELKEW